MSYGSFVAIVIVSPSYTLITFPDEMGGINGLHVFHVACDNFSSSVNSDINGVFKLDVYDLK